MIHGRLLLAILLLALVGASRAGAQESENLDGVRPQIWIDYDPIWVLSPKSELYGDVGFRTELENNGWGRFVLRPGFRYRPNEKSYLTAGIGSFYTSNKVFANTWEIRPFQGAAISWPTGWLNLQHYGRIEERFDFNTSDWDLEASLRLRYRLRAFHRWQTWKSEHHYWMALLSGEAFFTPFGDQGQFQEQIRLGVGVERSLNWGLRFRGNVTWQLRKADSSSSIQLNDLYIRIRVYHRWGG